MGRREHKRVPGGAEQTAGEGTPAQSMSATQGGILYRPTQVFIQYERTPDQELRDYLASAVPKYELWMRGLGEGTSGAVKEPYKGLYPFGIEDAAIFFGREGASKALLDKIKGDRLAVLYARSGAGKTSLLNAGLAPLLVREGLLPVYARVYDDPVRAIKRAIAARGAGSLPRQWERISLEALLGEGSEHLSGRTREWVVIVDQFEQLFIQHPRREEQQPFLEALAECYEDKRLRGRLVISVRSDYYSELDGLAPRISTVFENRYRLEPMTRGETKEAITGPLARLGEGARYAPELLEKLLDDLERGEMELPHLQILCTTLYEALPKGKKSITLEAYRALGGAEGILGGYLVRVLGELAGEKAKVARAALKELVSSEAERHVLSQKALAARLEVADEELEEVLGHLVARRLIRRDVMEGETLYNLAHEYLVRRVRGWIGAEELEAKRARELLEREVATWRTYGRLIPRDRLELLHAQRAELGKLDDEVAQCLMLSGLEAMLEAGDLVDLIGRDQAAEALMWKRAIT